MIFKENYFFLLLLHLLHSDREQILQRYDPQLLHSLINAQDVLNLQSEHIGFTSLLD